jgi:uncharacterized Fe-S cluster protein YjdI
MTTTGEEIEKQYTNGELTVVRRPGRCIHSRRCWKSLPSVFDPAKRPWIAVHGASSSEIATQVRLCPSGALSLLGENLTLGTNRLELPAVAPVLRAPTSAGHQLCTRDRCCKHHREPRQACQQRLLGVRMNALACLHASTLAA